MNTKQLIVAEKPSVAGDIARVLGAKKSTGKDFYENDNYVVYSAVGHLLEMVPPEGAEVKRGKWALANLPVLPDGLALNPIKKTETRLNTLLKLCCRKDVGTFINACDAGREGELIFKNIIRYLWEKKPKQEKKPIYRVWLRSMTPNAIKQGFNNLIDDKEMQNLQKAAVCRAEADWLIGINSTRAMTALNSSYGGFILTTLGRVQTPTLAVIVERDKQIDIFISQTYWEVRANFSVKAGSYEGVWINPESKEKPERIFMHDKVQEIITDCQGKTAEQNEKVKPVSEASPALFDLTSLQREANQRFSMSARNTLSKAQSLYEKYKLITYPRTDSRSLPEDYVETIHKVVKNIATLSQEEDYTKSTVADFAKKILQNNWIVGKDKRIFNNAKISDHFAIIPTGEIPKASLGEYERKIYDLILLRFLSVFYPPAKYLVTERKTMVGEHCFLTKGKVVVKLGWREVSSKMIKDTEVVTVSKDEKPLVVNVEEEEKQTQPPARYNESSLLSMMEGAGKRVENEELREAMKERGIGTPATRASIIEGLVRERYLNRASRDLISTPKAHSLIRLLHALKIEELTRPEMTGEWEYRLRQIEKKEALDNNFMDDIRRLTTTIVEAVKNCPDIENIEGNYAKIKAPCPQCQGQVQESHRRFSCGSCDFSVWKAVASREFSVAEMELILSGETTEELEGFRNRMGRDFSARIRLEKNNKNQWQTGFVFDQGTSLDSLDKEAFVQGEKVGDCSMCGKNVRYFENRYLCEGNLEDPRGCDFKITTPILGQEITVDQVKLLLTEGQTEILPTFVSKRTKRPFKARLTLDLKAKTGKIGFAFEPKAAKK